MKENNNNNNQSHLGQAGECVGGCCRRGCSALLYPALPYSTPCESCPSSLTPLSLPFFHKHALNSPSQLAFKKKKHKYTHKHSIFKYLSNKGRGPRFSRRHQNAILAACDVAARNPWPNQIARQRAARAQLVGHCQGRGLCRRRGGGNQNPAWSPGKPISARLGGEFKFV